MRYTEDCRSDLAPHLLSDSGIGLRIQLAHPSLQFPSSNVSQPPQLLISQAGSAEHYELPFIN